MLAGCGRGSGFVGGTVDNRVAASMHVGMGEGDAKHGLHGAPLDQLPSGLGGECVYYRGVDKSARNAFTATGKEWMFCFDKNKLTTVLRTCAARWRFGELDRYKKAGYAYNTARFHGDASDCRH
jgi:hypothetical protein